MDNETFFQRLLYNAYMADAITLSEVLDACNRLSIPVPTPSQFHTTHTGASNEHSNPRIRQLGHGQVHQPA